MAKHSNLPYWGRKTGFLFGLTKITRVEIETYHTCFHRPGEWYDGRSHCTALFTVSFMTDGGRLNSWLPWNPGCVLEGFVGVSLQQSKYCQRGLFLASPVSVLWQCEWGSSSIPYVYFLQICVLQEILDGRLLQWPTWGTRKAINKRGQLTAMLLLKSQGP